MKISYFRLKGYVKVLNGMGLDEIEIPFNTFKNRIILIQGENGTSKSTIVEALTPNPDPSDSFRTDVFIDNNGNRQIIEYPAEKEIRYYDIDESGFENEYIILIQSLVDGSKTKRTTKAYIFKNGENLNPNGNVSSFKEIRDSLLGIDPIYLDLSSVGNEHRGIVDMIPSERRKYMASYIGSLDTYNKIFKIISKKVTGLKSYINTINSKIYELGNENELRLKLSNMDSSLKQLNSQRDSLMKSLAEAEATVKIVDPNNEMQDIFESISRRLTEIKSNITSTLEELEKYRRAFPKCESLEDYERKLKSIEDDIERYRSLIVEKTNKISNLMTLNEYILSKIESDRNILLGLDSSNIPYNIESAVEELNKQKDRYMEYLTPEDIEFLKSISLEELNDLRDTLNGFLQEVSVAEELHSLDCYSIAVDSYMNPKLEKELQDKKNYHTNRLSENKSLIASLSVRLESLKNDMRELSEFSNTRPAECKIDSCPYILRYISLKNNGISEKDIEDIDNQIRVLEDEIRESKSTIEMVSYIEEISKYLNIAFAILFGKKSLIRKIDGLSYLVDDISELKEKMKSLYRFPEFKIVSSLIEKYTMYEDYKKIKVQLDELSGDLKIYQSNKSTITSLNKSISTNQKEYDDRNDEIISTNKDIEMYNGFISDLSVNQKVLSKIVNLLHHMEDLNRQYDDLKEEFNSVKDKIRLVKEKVESVNGIKNDILKVEESIKPLKNSIDQTNYALSNIIAYQEEYKEYSDTYDKMLFIRNCCSPGSGTAIQSEYIKRYMNDIIIDCNKMLSFMFNGTIQLDIPVITQNDFLIPFIGPNGLIVPDIGAGSTAQRCMIGLVFSCVSLMKASSKYRILRLDELDGGLDQQNRVSFILVLNKILDFMRCDQCVIVSHNSEFDSHNVTRLYFSRTGIKIEQ